MRNSPLGFSNTVPLNVVDLSYDHTPQKDMKCEVLEKYKQKQLNLEEMQAEWIQ